MANTSERVKALKKHFIEERQRGLTISEIAKRYKVSQRHIYFLLQEIADENGVSRRSLLDIPHKQHSQRTDCISNESIDIESIQELFENILTEIHQLNNIQLTVEEKNYEY